MILDGDKRVVLSDGNVPDRVISSEFPHGNASCPGPGAVDVSVIMPCLNEEAALAGCIHEALGAIAGLGIRGEVVVVDNYLRRWMAQETQSEALIPTPNLHDRASIFKAASGKDIQVHIADCTDYRFMEGLFKTFQPEAGKLLGWNNRRPDGRENPSTIHHGMKVRKGVKYVITTWYREKEWGW